MCYYVLGAGSKKVVWGTYNKNILYTYVRFSKKNKNVLLKLT